MHSSEMRTKGDNHENRSDWRYWTHWIEAVKKLREHGQEVVAASPNSGVNTLTGEGLAEALKGTSVVVDVTNSPSWEDAAVLKFFETSTRNLLDYEAAAGVRHHVALSVVGTERLLESGFFRAKIVQENLIKASSIPVLNCPRDAVLRIRKEASPIIPRRATRCACLLRSSSLWQPMMSPVQ